VLKKVTLDKRPARVAAMFDTVALRYDLMNALCSVGMVWCWRRSTLRQIDPKPGMSILDVAGGTGTSAAPLAKRGARVTVVDLSAGMVEVGRRHHPELDFRVGDAAKLPFEDDTFDVTTISYGLRNTQNPEIVLSELRRVTKPGGRLVVAEFSTPVFPVLSWAYLFWLKKVMPLIAKLGSNQNSYGYLADSILAWPDQKTLAALLRKAGWGQVRFRNLSGGIVALHTGVAVPVAASIPS
jgi:demethylmenaquinone methyltransferase/2-methoxy-6-polyprenyl-1,4-benzoquinol methylase